MTVIPYILAAVLGYLIGAIPTGYLVVRHLTGQDIREIGSGGTGATNVRRVVGGKAALFVMAFDIAKGLVPVLIARALFPTGSPDEPVITLAGYHIGAWAGLHVLVALMTVIGHSKSVFIGMKGGKSAATGLGGMIGLAWLPAVLVGLIAFVVTKISRYQSVGSLMACVFVPLLLWLFGAPVPYIIYGAVAALFVIYMHKANIGRLLNGTENRL